MARPRSFDESAVLNAARDEFWTKGYAATSMDDLTAATGLGKGSLYGAFGDKHQLFLRVLDEYCDGAVAGLGRALEGPDMGARERLRAHLLAVATVLGTDTGRRGCLLSKGTAELGGTDSEVAQLAREALGALEEHFVACVAQAQRAGEIDPQADARAVGRLLLAVQRGLEALGKAGMDGAALVGIVETAMAAVSPKASTRLAR